MRSIRILRGFTWLSMQEAGWEFWALNQFERKTFLAVASYCPGNNIQELTAVFFQMLSHVQHIIQIIIIIIIKEVLIWIICLNFYSAYFKTFLT